VLGDALSDLSRRPVGRNDLHRWWRGAQAELEGAHQPVRLADRPCVGEPCTPENRRRAIAAASGA